MKKNISIKITEEPIKTAGLFDDMTGEGLAIIIGVAVVAVILMIVIGAVIYGIAVYRPNSTINSSMNSSQNCINKTCPVCNADNFNYSSYKIPETIPNIDLTIKDGNCNDYCYYQSAKYSCTQWSNIGMKYGKCQCSLQNCLIDPLIKNPLCE